MRPQNKFRGNNSLIIAVSIRINLIKKFKRVMHLDTFIRMKGLIILTAAANIPMRLNTWVVTDNSMHTNFVGKWKPWFCHTSCVIKCVNMYIKWSLCTNKTYIKWSLCTKNFVIKFDLVTTHVFNLIEYTGIFRIIE